MGVFSRLVSEFEQSSLIAQWVGSGSAVAAVLVAVVFGYLTLANTRRSKDTQQRSTMVAAFEAPDSPESILGSNVEAHTSFSIRQGRGESWLLINEGPDIAYSIQVDGLTDLDKRRLREVARDPGSLGVGDAKEFVLVSRLTLSGPANVVVSYSLEPGGPQLRRVLQVPAQ